MYPTTQLQPGSTGSEVIKLQTYLVSQGLLTQAQMNTGPGIYGPATTAAVKALQQRLGVDNSSGPGYWGPKTIAAVGTKTTTPPESTTQGTPSDAAKNLSISLTGQNVTLPDGRVRIGEGTQASPYRYVDPSQVPSNTKSGLPDGLRPSFVDNGVQIYTANDGNSYNAQGQRLEQVNGSTHWTLPSTTPAPSSSGSLEDTLYQQLATYLEDLKKRGQVLNPNIQITPEQAAQFTAQAQQEIDPYYATQLKLARESLLRSVGYSQTELDAKEKEIEQTYGTNLRKTGENFADQGFAQSGLRNRAEGQLATDTQNQIDSGRRALNFGAEGLAQGFAQQYGSRDLPSLSGSSAPTVQAGQSGFTRPSGQSSYYQLSPQIYDNLVGTKQFEQTGAVRSRASELESAFRTGQSLQEQRQLL